MKTSRYGSKKRTVASDTINAIMQISYCHWGWSKWSQCSNARFWRSCRKRHCSYVPPLMWIIPNKSCNTKTEAPLSFHSSTENTDIRMTSGTIQNLHLEYLLVVEWWSVVYQPLRPGFCTLCTSGGLLNPSSFIHYEVLCPAVFAFVQGNPATWSILLSG